MRYIYLDNDYQEYTRPVVGLNAAGRRELYHSTDMVAYFTDDPESTTPIGTLTTTCPEVGTSGRYMFVFDAAAINTSLAALDDETIVYRVISGPGDVKVVDPVTFRRVRPSDPI